MALLAGFGRLAKSKDIQRSKQKKLSRKKERFGVSDNPSNNHPPGEGDRQKKQQREQFFYPRARYQGEFTPEQLAFNANLQEFAQRVGLVCALETGGKLESLEAYHRIKDLWKELKLSKDQLLDRPDLPDVELPPDGE